MGAMENKGLNIFNSHYVLADEDSATDTNFMGIESVIAHEYFHNWTGNRITCRSWFELTLKEGLTVFRDQMFSADMNSQEVQRIEDVKSLRQRQFAEDASPTSHPIQPKSYISMNNFYTATVYEKGAEVIRMIYTLVGKDRYRDATDLYFEKFDGQAVRIQEFLWAMSEGAKIDLSDFERWYHQSKTPTLKVKEHYENETLSVIFEQKIPDDLNGNKQKHYFFPLKIGILDADGNELVDEMLIIKDEVSEFKFENITSKPTLSINRDFSAPIIVEQENVDFAFLMKYDRNSFTRYEATQNFAIEVIQKLILGKDIDEEFVKSFGYLLDLDIDLSYKSLLLELPSISTLMQKEDVVDFEKLYDAKDKLEYILASTYKDKLLDIYNSFKPDSIKNRAIRNRVLKLLSSLKTDDIVDIAKEQYFNSNNMTDRLSALQILTDFKVETVLEDFYNRYKEDTLVMNKYFATIASSKQENLLETIINLENDEVYDNKVPNLVRSLIGAFTQNYKEFHKKDGSGYKYVADKIIELDKINAQIASSLCSSFKIYNKLNTKNKTLMQKELNRVKSTHSLSDNSTEILEKILKND